MSADNYLYVGKTADGRFGLSMRFASSDYPDVIAKAYATFDTADAAIRRAHEDETEDYYEYGVVIAPDVLAEWSRA
jgi:hypothetical protein